MHKQPVLRTPLIAVLGFLAFLVVPAAAQAHHITASATCALKGNVPTVDYKVQFVGFGATAQPTVNGTVRLNGGTVRTVTNSGGLTWSSGNASISGSAVAKPGSNTVVASFTWKGGGDKKTIDTLACPKPGTPDISLDKTGAATAAAGATFTYSFTATNTGDVALTDVQLADPKCQSTMTRVGANAGDTTFDPTEQWFYTCTVVAPAGPAEVYNIAKVCGDYDAGGPTPIEVCDEDDHTFTVPPVENPPSNPPVNPPASVTPDVVEPQGEVLPESILSGRAQLRGPSGCVKQAFRARVSGRSIASVVFFVDGRKVKQVRRGDAFSLKVNPGTYGLGRHKIVALVRFRAESGTSARRLPLTFRRCAQGAVAPRFTG